MKTNVLFLQTSTKAPIIKTADVPIPASQPHQSSSPVAPVVPTPSPSPENKNGVPISVLPVPIIPALANPAPIPAPVFPAPGTAAPIVPANPIVKPIAGLGSLGDAIISALGVSVSSPAKAAQVSVTPVLADITAAPAGITPAPPGIPSAPIGPPAIPSAGQKVTANSVGQFVMAPGTTITPGGPAQVIAGSTISIGFSPGGSIIAVINGQTSTLSGAVPLFAAPPAFGINGTTFSPSVSAGFTFYVVDGTTLAQGQVATVHGTTLSLASGGDLLVINGSASTILKATSSIQCFEGAAMRQRIGWTAGMLVVVAMLFGSMM